MKCINRIVSCVLCAALLTGALSGCAGRADSASESGNASASDSVSSNRALQEALEGEVAAPDTSDATGITLSDKAITVAGDGAESADETVTITAGGTYVLTGEITDGRVLVNAPNEEVVLVLENADIRCSYGSPLYIYKSLRTTVYLAEGTQNTLTDGSEYTFLDRFSSTAEEPNACLYSKSDLVIAGKGRLTVNANYNNGITSKDTLKIEASLLTVTAKNHGVNGKDCCVVKNAAMQITAGGDALRSTNDTDSTLGYIVIADSSLNLTAGEDGIQAQTALTIRDGTYTVVSGGGSGGKVSADTSAKGLKGGSDVTLYDGVYTLNCYDDAIHANGNVLIAGGTYTIATADDGIHADNTAAIAGGTVTVTKSYEGIEGATVDISGGTVRVTASDDGINAAGGTDQSGFGARKDTFAVSSGGSINLSGGVITVEAAGDGVDSNGSLTVSGGELYVSGPTSSGNGALDYDGEATITGGIVVAAGASGMAQNFGSNSTQGSILLTYSASSSSTVTLKDASGNTLVSYTPTKSYNCVVISCPSITVGGTYTVEAAGQTTSVTMSSLIYGNSTGMDGMGGPGNRFGRP